MIHNGSQFCELLSWFISGLGNVCGTHTIVQGIDG